MCLYIFLYVPGYVLIYFFVCAMICVCNSICILTICVSTTRNRTTLVCRWAAAAAVRFGTPCLMHRTQLTHHREDSQLSPKKERFSGPSETYVMEKTDTWSPMRAGLSGLWPMCVCVCVAVPPRPLPPAKAGEKAGRVGAAADQNRFRGVVRKKSNMGVGRPVGTGGGRGHPRHPQTIWRHMWKVADRHLQSEPSDWQRFPQVTSYFFVVALLGSPLCCENVEQMRARSDGVMWDGEREGLAKCERN